MGTNGDTDGVHDADDSRQVPAWRYELCRIEREHDLITRTVLDHVEDGWLYAGEEPVGGEFVDIVFRRPASEHDSPWRGRYRRPVVM